MDAKFECILRLEFPVGIAPLKVANILPSNHYQQSYTKPMICGCHSEVGRGFLWKLLSTAEA